MINEDGSVPLYKGYKPFRDLMRKGKIMDDSVIRIRQYGQHLPTSIV